MLRCLRITRGGRTAKKAGSHTTITITFPGLTLEVGEHLIQPIVVVVVARCGDLGVSLELVVHRDGLGR